MLLFSDIVFGPIHSRRLGTSLGINLMPTQHKCCNFNCIYCECGWNITDSAAMPKAQTAGQQLPSVAEVADALSSKLSALRQQSIVPDVFTFSGNGEPTLHPHFKEVMQETVRLRNAFFPKAQICVLSNAGFIHKPAVFEGLVLADQRILKIDAAREDMVALINQPAPGYSLSATIEHLKAFNGHFTLQSMFLKGSYNGKSVDNTSESSVAAWMEIVRQLHPDQVMVYTIDRPTPATALEKCPLARLEEIASYVRALGIQTTVAG